MVFNTAVINRPAYREQGVDLANIVHCVEFSSLLSDGIYLFYFSIFSSETLTEYQCNGLFLRHFKTAFPCNRDFITLRLAKKELFLLFTFQHIVSLAGSFEAHLQHLSKLSLLHTQKRYRLSLSVCRTISILTFSKAELTLIISFAVAASSVVCLE